jgi:hypothetical protein
MGSLINKYIHRIFDPSIHRVRLHVRLHVCGRDVGCGHLAWAMARLFVCLSVDT